MLNLELKKVVLDSSQVHIDALTEPIFPDSGHWKIELGVTVGAVRYSIHSVVANPFGVINAVNHLTLAVGWMLDAILAVSGFRAKLMRYLATSR